MDHVLGLAQVYQVVKTPFAQIRLCKITIAGYIDDLFTTPKSCFSCESNIHLCVQVLDWFDFVVHPNKSIFTPTKIIGYPGFIVN